MNRLGTIGIVTVTYNSSDVLPGFLASLESQTYKEFILYAIDNASKDSSVEQLNRWSDTRIRVTPNAENIGVAEGNNQGTRAAIEDGCKYILYLNNDVEFECDTLATLVNEINDLHCDLIAPKILFGDRKHIWAAGGGFCAVKGYLGFHAGEGEVDRGQYEVPRRIRHAPTCCLLVRSSVVNKVGLMDPIYFVYVDDADFTFRAWHAGLKMYYTPRVSIYHKVSSLTGGSKSAFTLRYNTRGHIYFMLKNLGVWRCLYYLPAFELRLLYKWLSRSIDHEEFSIRQRAVFEGINMWRSSLTPLSNSGTSIGSSVTPSSE